MDKRDILLGENIMPVAVAREHLGAIVGAFGVLGYTHFSDSIIGTILVLIIMVFVGFPLCRKIGE